MLSERSHVYGKERSIIRDQYEYAQEKAKTIGWENICNLCIGNPSVPTPEIINETLREVTKTMDSYTLHGYTASAGAEPVRQAFADSMNRRYGTNYKAENLYLTTGAAMALNVSFRAICNPGDEVVVVAPYFPEYKFYINAIDCVCVEVPPRTEDFQINFDALRKSITDKTKAVIINSPNNPSGAIYSEETIKELASILNEASEKRGAPIYLISDDPYKEIVYDGIKIPFVPLYYRNTIVVYSFSKCLSLPGERIGYLALNNGMDGYDQLLFSVWGAARVLGFVNAPSIFQWVMARCCDEIADMSTYRENRDLLYDGLTKMGYDVVKPGGTFYMFPKSPEPNANAFMNKAKEYNLLIVPGDDFGCPGHFRLTYCVPRSTVEKALEIFARLAKDYGLTPKK